MFPFDALAVLMLFTAGVGAFAVEFADWKVPPAAAPKGAVPKILNGEVI
jgi:hypothetical protein